MSRPALPLPACRSTALLIAASNLQDRAVLALLGLGADPAAANNSG